MPRLVSNRVIVTLIDKDGNKIERRISNITMVRVKEFLKIKSNLDRSDKIIVESEEL